MKTLLGGAAAVLLGIIGLTIWFKPFLNILAGSIPFFLVAGGALAVYLGYDELKDGWKKDTDDTTTPVSPPEDVEKYKQEIDTLKSELEELKTSKEKDSAKPATAAKIDNKTAAAQKN